MTRNREIFAFAVLGFVFATLVQLPAILDARAARAARDLAYAQEFGS